MGNLDKLEKVNSRYGAPLGRRCNISEPDARIKMRLTRLRFIDGVYDEGGAYWGSPANVYWARGDGEEEVQVLFVRASSRQDAKAQVRQVFQNARFYN